MPSRDADQSIFYVSCPTPAILKAYAVGNLPPAVFEAVASHLLGCQGCELLLDQLAVSEDGLVSRLRQCVSASEQRECPLLVDPLVQASNRFTGYQLENQLAAGALWTVFKARQQLPSRMVALKIASVPDLGMGVEFARFWREMAGIAQLWHPNIVTVYEYGQEMTLPYFSMEWIQGGTLASRLRQGGLSGREAVEIVLALCCGILYAHDQGFLHHDLQPSKVYFSAGGTAKITGFGMWKCQQANDDWTTTDSDPITSPFLAPERIWGDAQDIGAGVDVYGLGAILYACLTGQPPFQAKSMLKTLELIRTAQPDPLSKYCQVVDSKLEAICQKCLEKEPQQRYRTIQALADDLSVWLGT